MRCLIVRCVLSIFATHTARASPRISANPVDPIIIASADYAVQELRKLSDSGVYETLGLSEIVSASTQVGVFHNNTFLLLRLSSEYFWDGEPTADFKVMVMKHHEDGAHSFAIDEFPEMNEDAIEKFWILKIEEQRAIRDNAFQKMETEAFGGISSELQEPGDLLKALAQDTSIISHDFGPTPGSLHEIVLDSEQGVSSSAQQVLNALAQPSP